MSLPDAPLTERIKADQVDMLYRQMPISSASAAGTAVIVSAVMWPVVPAEVLMAWFSAIMLVSLLRAFDAYQYQKDRERFPLPVWENRFLVGTVASGIAWGSAAIALFPQDLISYQYFIALVLLGIASGAIATYPVHLRVFYVFFFSVMSPLLLQLLGSNDQGQYGVGLMGIVFLLFVSAHARNINRAMNDSFRLRYETIDLLEKLRLQKEAVERASNEKSAFIAAANHDIRQPLQALNLLFSVLRRESREERREHISWSIHRCLDSLCTVLDGLMDVSSLQTGQVTAVNRHFTLQPRLNELKTLFQPLADEKGLIIDIPESSLVLYSDPVLLQRILRNLLSNAIKYTPSGEVSVRIIREADHARIVVADTGIGIPEQFRAEIFRGFFRVDSKLDGRSDGLGLGLAIVRGLARIIDCPVSVESECGKGSRFSLRIPLGSSAMVEADPAEHNHSDSLLGGLCVVVIDDDKDVLDAMTLMLGKWGCSVVAVSCVEDAIRAMDQRKGVPDVVVADYRLNTDISGANAVEALNTHFGKDIPAMLMTGDTGLDRRCQSSQRNFTLLRKPITPAALGMAIRRCHQKRLGRPLVSDDVFPERRFGPDGRKSECPSVGIVA